MKQSYLHGTITLGDTAKILSNIAAPLIFVDLDIQIQTHPATYGDRNAQTIELNVGDVLSYRTEKGVDLREIFFKNTNAGNNSVIGWAGVLKE